MRVRPQREVRIRSRRAQLEGLVLFSVNSEKQFKVSQ